MLSAAGEHGWSRRRPSQKRRSAGVPSSPPSAASQGPSTASPTTSFRPSSLPTSPKRSWCASTKPPACWNRGWRRNGTPRTALTYTLTLRDGIKWSDGMPFTSADVVFSFDAAYQKGGILGSALAVGGVPLKAAATGPNTVAVTYPAHARSRLAPARQSPDSAEAQARRRAAQRQVQSGVVGGNAAVRAGRPGAVHARPLRARSAAHLRPQPATTGGRTIAASRCPTSIASSWRSSPSRTPRSCACKPGRST